MLDFEDAKIAYKIFGKGITKETLCVKSGSGKGLHIYLRAEYKCHKFKISEIALDVQAEGSYVASAPSLHPSGNLYEVIRWQKVKKIEGDFEEWLYSKIQEKIKKFDPQKHRECIDAVKLLQVVEVGARNNSALFLSTWFRRAGKTQEETTAELEIWNGKLKEPLPQKELMRTIRSAYNKEEPYKYWFKQNPEAYKEIEQFTREDEDLARQFLLAPTKKKFKFILKALEEIVREEKTKVSLFLLELANESAHIAGDSSEKKPPLRPRSRQLQNQRMFPQ